MSTIIHDISQAAEELLKGGIVAIPTETVYGLAAFATHDQAVERVFSIKQRPRNHPLILHVAPDWDIRQWVEAIPEYAQQFMKKFWPGPLTVVLPCRPYTLSPLVNAGQNSVAIRSPAHPLTIALLERIQVPLVAPSANPFGKISPTTASHVQRSFPEDDFQILEGGRCDIGIESTIVSALDPRGWQILRPGMIHSEMLLKQCDQELVEPSHDIRVPGRLPAHYQPEKTLYYFESEEDLLRFLHAGMQNVFVLHSRCPSEHSLSYFAQLPPDPAGFARDLYFQLRAADESNARCIAIVLPPASNENQGIRERIIKAGSPAPS